MDIIKKIRGALKEVRDPEMGLNIIDLGLVYDIKVEDQTAMITMTLTSPSCPIGPMIVDDIHYALEKFSELEKISVDIIWSPPWDVAMMSEEAKDQLGIF